MHLKGSRLALALVLLLAPWSAIAEEIMIERFEDRPETRWRFFTDRVMGGVSSGQVAFTREGAQTHAAMRGQVSTANNGGFIQIRADLPGGAPPEAKGVRLVVRGNNQPYYVHIRTRGTRLPWQYYQARFDVTGNWAEIRLPFKEFKRSGRLISASLEAENLRTVGLVAYGRDHDAELDIREVGFY